MRPLPCSKLSTMSGNTRDVASATPGVAVRGLPTAENPCQQAMLAGVSPSCRPEEIQNGRRRRGVVTFALPLERRPGLYASTSGSQPRARLPH